MDLRFHGHYVFSLYLGVIVSPSKLQGVSAIAGEGQVTISWDNSQSARSYNIYWSESARITTENGKLISNIVRNSHNINVIKSVKLFNIEFPIQDR